MSKTISKTRALTGLAMLTAIVVVLQLLGASIRFGVFSISLVLIPIVIGAALYGVAAGAWLGFVFGFVVLISGDANVFMSISPIGTIITCLAKGTAAGAAAGFVYRLIAKGDDTKRDVLAVFAAAIIAPICNTGIFLIGCCLFFLDTVAAWGQAAGFTNVGTYMITGFVGLNFVFEVLVNVVLSPVVVRLVKYVRNYMHI